MAGVAALFTLSANQGWLLPSVDEGGAAYLEAAVQITSDAELVAPWSSWDGGSEPLLEGRGLALPHLMASLLPLRPQPHVVALWSLAGSFAVLLLFVGWTAGGAGGIQGALLSGLLLAASPLAFELATSIRPELLAMAFIAFQLGLFTYQPRWSVVHGAVGALAWLAHPAGIGAVLAAVALAWWSRDTRPAALRASLGAVASSIVLVLVIASTGGGAVAALYPGSGAGVDYLLDGVTGLLRHAGGGWGALSVAIGLGVVGGTALLVVLEWVDSPAVLEDVDWKDERASDRLAELLRPAAVCQFIALGLVSLLSGRGADSLGAPWALALVPATILAGTAVTRYAGRWGWRSVPVVAAGVWLAGSGFASQRTLHAIQTDGRGLTHRSWVSSEVIRWVDNRSDGVDVFYSDEPALLQIQSGERARRLPARVDDLEAFARAFASAPGALIVTTESALGVEDFVTVLDLSVAEETPEGTVLLPVR